MSYYDGGTFRIVTVQRNFSISDLELHYDHMDGELMIIFMFKCLIFYKTSPDKKHLLKGYALDRLLLL